MSNKDLTRENLLSARKKKARKRREILRKIYSLREMQSMSVPHFEKAILKILQGEARLVTPWSKHKTECERRAKEFVCQKF